MKKHLLGIFLVMVSMLLVGSVYAQEGEPASNDYTAITDEATLTSCLANGTICTLSANVTINNPLSVSRAVTVKGEGHTLSFNQSSMTGSLQSNVNATIITAVEGGDLTLENIILENSKKYGVQAYNGGKVTLKGVNIKNCAYGAVLVNGGEIKIEELTMSNNGDPENGGNGIEIGQGELVTHAPKVVLDGEIKLEGTGQTNYLWVAENDQLKGFTVDNAEDSPNKLQIQNGKVVLIDEKDNVISTSNEAKKGVIVTGDTYKEPEVKDTAPKTGDTFPITLVGIITLGLAGTYTFKKLHN